MTTETTATSAPATEAGEPTTAENQAASTAEQQSPPAADTKPEGDKPAEPQVPEAYEFKMPDGVELDTAAADEFSALAKELKLDQDTAQKVADIGAKMAQRQTEKHAELVKSWVEQAKADKEIGGDKFDEHAAIARTAIERFGTPELKDVLNMTGLGNHPAFIKAFVKIGKAISEDGFVRGGGPQGGATDPAKKLFPNMN